MIWSHQPVPWEQVEQAIADLTALQNCPDRAKVVETLRRIVPEYEPQNPPAQSGRQSLPSEAKIT
jgi:hypothetical protein